MISIFLDMAVWTLGGFTVWKFRRKNFTEMFKQNFFLIIGVLVLVQQVIMMGFRIRQELFYILKYTDMCNMCVLFVGLSGILYHWNKWLLKMIIPWTFLGATIGLAFESSANDPIQLQLNNFFTHISMLIFCFGSLILIQDYDKKDVRNSFFFIVLFLVYVILLTFPLGYFVNNEFYRKTTGLFPQSYEKGGEYYVMSKMHLPYPIPTIIFYSVCSGITYGYWRMIFKSNNIKWKQHSSFWWWLPFFDRIKNSN